MGKENKVNRNHKLTNHFTYRIIDNTIYLFQNVLNVSDEELTIAFKKLALLIEDNDIDYINISARKIEERKDFYQNLGFTLSFYDVNKLNELYYNKKDKIDYKCYALITKKDFFDRENKKEFTIKEEKIVTNSNGGYVSNLLLLFGGIVLLCFFCVEGAILLVK
ncbi:MAG: hypothetical protein ACI31S_01705 [Bacilli bacterium]